MKLMASNFEGARNKMIANLRHSRNNNASEYPILPLSLQVDETIAHPKNETYRMTIIFSVASILKFLLIKNNNATEKKTKSTAKKKIVVLSGLRRRPPPMGICSELSRR